MSDDLISRQAAIDALLHNQEVYANHFGNDPIDKYTIALIDNDAQTIAQLPSAQPEKCEDCGNFNKARLLIPQPEQKWIPVSERLPKNERYVLVTTVSGDVTEAKYWQEEGLWVKGLVVMSVTAWMPFMEPYKGDTGNANKTD